VTSKVGFQAVFTPPDSHPAPHVSRSTSTPPNFTCFCYW